MEPEVSFTGLVGAMGSSGTKRVKEFNRVAPLRLRRDGPTRKAMDTGVTSTLLTSEDGSSELETIESLGFHIGMFLFT